MRMQPAKGGVRPAGGTRAATWEERMSERAAAARMATPEVDSTPASSPQQPTEAVTQQPPAAPSDLIKTASSPATPGRKALNVVVHAFSALTPTRRVASAPGPGGRGGLEAGIDPRQLVSRSLPKIRTDRVPSPHWSSRASAAPEAIAEDQAGRQRQRLWVFACCSS